MQNNALSYTSYDLQNINWSVARLLIYASFLDSRFINLDL